MYAPFVPLIERNKIANTKNRKLILLIALVSAFPPLSTDMYLPALPLLKEMWHEPLTTINMTLVVFFISYCVSLLCGFSDDALMLIVLRALQGA
jgi:MFS family permease